MRLAGGEVLVVGGFNDAGGALGSTERYMPGGNCVPLTCGEQSGACGVVPDGCGGLLDCGLCDGGQK
jgi:hypothetical protein